MSDYVSASHVVLGCSASTVDEVLKLLSEQAVSFGIATDAEALCEAFKAREAEGTTGMMGGFAIPHAKLHGLARNAVVIGISRIPVPFGGKEGTRVFFLVLARDDSPAEHIQLLSSIAKVASSQLFVRMLLSSKTPQDVYQLFFE